MKRLALLATALLLASPALADGLDRPRHTKRPHVERYRPIVAYACQPAPTALYDSYYTPPYRSYVWRGVPRRYTYPCAPVLPPRYYGYHFR